MANTKNAAEIEKLKEKAKQARKSGQNPVQYESTLRALRKLLVEAITEEDLFWYTLHLRMGQRGELTAQYRIKICAPVFVYGFFVPVTANETWTLAAKFNAFPFTRAVADQQVNDAVDKGLFVTCMPQNIDTHGPGFDVFTEKLLKTKYSQGVAPVFGSHKLWLLSASLTDKKPVNYGFHHKGKRLPYAQGDKGRYHYPEYSVINGLIPAHDWAGHWDYSQLLQLMKSLHDSKGSSVDLRQALLNKHPAVWDEGRPPDSTRFPKK